MNQLLIEKARERRLDALSFRRRARGLAAVPRVDILNVFDCYDLEGFYDLSNVVTLKARASKADVGTNLALRNY